MAGGTRDARVWDPLVRACHWSLVAAIAAAWFTRHGQATWHERVGYAALAIVALRVIWGFAGTRYARFAGFVRGPVATLDYARQVLAHTERRHVGHNPLGGWMIVALLAFAALAAGTGWLYTTDRFWGETWLEALHRWLTYGLLGLVALHVAGVVFTSRRQRENLVAAMLSGRKRAASGNDIE